MKIETITIKVTTTEPVLGLSSANRQIQEEFIASKAPTVEAAKEEVEAIDVRQEIEKATTVFPKDEQGLFWWDYQMRGAFKGWLLTLIELGDTKLSRWQYKRAVDTLLFVKPRRIYIKDPSGAIYTKADGTMQRPLRAETMQGDRIALASSEMLPAGANWEFSVALLTGSNPKSNIGILKLDTVENCLELGSYSGFGQWRGGGFGRFTYEIVNQTPAPAEAKKAA